MPVNLIWMSSSGLRPARWIICIARSRMRMGWPMSRMKISPPRPMAPACITSWLASGMVMKYRCISGWVTVTGPPAAICFWKIGTTLPLLPSTLPKRTEVYLVPQFGYALGGSHHVGRANRLVRRDHDEVLDAKLGCDLPQVVCTHIVLHRLEH